MPRKKKPPAPARIGRPPVYGERVRWLVHVPLAVAAAVDKKRKHVSRAAVVQQALAAWLEREG